MTQLPTPDNLKWQCLVKHSREIYQYKNKYILKKDKFGDQNHTEVTLLLNKDKLPQKIKMGKYTYKFIYPDVVNYDKKDFTWAIFTYIGKPEYHKRTQEWDDKVLANMLDTITFIRLSKIMSMDLHESNVFVDHKERLIYIWDLGYESDLLNNRKDKKLAK